MVRGSPLTAEWSRSAANHSATTVIEKKCDVSPRGERNKGANLDAGGRGCFLRERGRGGRRR